MSHISKFNGTNFPLWKFQLFLVFEQHNLKDIVLGSSKRPKSEDQDSIKQIHYWDRMDNAARCYIVSTMEERWIRILMSCKTANEMWTRLVAQHEQASQENKLLWQQKFFEYRFKEGNSVMEHICEIEYIANQLADLNAPVSELQTITKIITTLPPVFRPAISAWNMIDESRKTLNYLASRLLEEEKSLQVKEHYAQQEGALIAKKIVLQNNSQGFGKQQPMNKQVNKSFNKNEKCEYCLKRNFRANHQESKCWRKEAYLEGRKDAGLMTTDMDTDMATAFTSISFNEKDITSTECWFADSGATQHMTDQRSIFKSFNPIDYKWPVQGIGKNNAPLQVEGMGNIHVECYVDGNWNTAILYDVLYVPNLGANLFSIRAAASKGVSASFNEESIILQKSGKKVAMGKIYKRLYCLHLRIGKEKSSAFIANSLSIWHQRLGHVNCKTLLHMAKQELVNGLQIGNKENDEHFCEGCVLGKQHRLPFPYNNRCVRTSQVGEIIHSDVCGPMNTESVGGNKYFVVFKDDFSGYRSISFMKSKNETFRLLTEFVARLERETSKKVIAIQSDNGGEYTSIESMDWFKSNGIIHRTSVAKTPQQNGAAERENRTIVETARAMIHSSKLPIRLWAEACACAVYLLNRIQSSTRLGTTPFEQWFGRKPDVSHLKIFGSVAYLHIPKDERNKFDAKSEKYHLIGYSETQKAYKLWHPTTGKMKIGRDVIFNEVLLQNSGEYTELFDGTESSELASTQVTSTNEEHDGFQRRFSLRNRRAPIRWSEEQTNDNYAQVACSTDILEPETYEEALNSDNSTEWIKAMEDEFTSLQQNKTWCLVPLPEGRKAINNKWVFKVKYNSKNQVERFKARLVAKGYSQVEGIDYNETYSPVVRQESLRIILSIAATEDLEIMQLDVKTAFLHGELQEDIYMKQPKRFH